MFKKKIKQLEETQKLLIQEVKNLKEIIERMWDETHPPTMGGK